MAIIKDGKVKSVGEPLTLLKDLKAQVWTGLVTKKDFKNVKNGYQVISSKLSLFKSTNPSSIFSPNLKSYCILLKLNYRDNTKSNYSIFKENIYV